MTIRLGEKIRSLRKGKNISQEVLAQYLGISFQAVSKWENGDSLPDVELIPAIASFFDVSTDELFDFNRLETAEKIQKACWDIAEYRYSDPERAEEDLCGLLKQYPGNDVILANLICSLQVNERYEELIDTCKAQIQSTTQDDLRYDAARILAETYHRLGQQELVKPTLERIPEFYFTKLELIALLTDGQEAVDAGLFQAKLFFDDLIGLLLRLSKLHRDSGDESKAEAMAELARSVYATAASGQDALGFSDNALFRMREAVTPQ